MSPETAAIPSEAGPAETVTPPSTIGVVVGESLGVQRFHQVDFPQTPREDYMAVPHSDWDRVKRRVSQVIKPPPSFSGVYYTLFGIAATALCSVLPFFQVVTEPKPWVRPFFWVLFAFSFFFGGVFIWVDRVLKKKNQADIKDILADMTDVEKRYKGK